VTHGEGLKGRLKTGRAAAYRQEGRKSQLSGAGFTFGSCDASERRRLMFPVTANRRFCSIRQEQNKAGIKFNLMLNMLEKTLAGVVNTFEVTHHFIFEITQCYINVLS